MLEIKGAFNTAKVYTDTVDEGAICQIQTMTDSEIFKDSKIAIMPDVHAGAGCTIGTTMTLTDKVVPNMVGVDIGCGMEVVRINEKEIDFEKLDYEIRRGIPSGRNNRKKELDVARSVPLDKLRCYSGIKKIEEEYKAIGSLGGGNHFIEVDKDEEGRLYVVIHSGSRHLGKTVAEYYQEQAYKQCHHLLEEDIQKFIDRLKEDGKETEIEEQLKKYKAEITVPKSLAYCSGELFDDYIHDMKIMQKFADVNRKAMMDIVIKEMNLTPVERFTTIHNYIDTEHMILRKGAVSAEFGEKLLIPINMKDGSLICIGKGNPEWNNSAPHGAGRLYSRRDSKKRFTVEEFEKEMAGIYSTTINQGTLDECPMAYKDMSDIVENIGPTAEIISMIKPLYNFKAEE